MVLVDAGCEFQVLLSLQQGVRMVHCGVQYKYIVRFLGTAQSTAGCQKGAFSCTVQIYN